MARGLSDQAEASVGVPDRREQLATNLRQVRARIATAAAAVGRSADEITLVAVTKTFPATDVLHLAALGVGDVGENYVQELAAKTAECAQAGLPAGALRWHFVGQLQTNKARQVAALVDMVHSVDRPRLVDALSRAAARRARPLTCLVQVDVTDEAHVDQSASAAKGPARVGARAGAAPRHVPELAEQISRSAGLRLGGVMAVAGRDQDPAVAFARLRAVAEQVRADYPSATIISAGMSRDLEAAVAAGATHVRVGAALLGTRPALR